MEGIWSRQQQYSSSFNNFCDMHVKLFDLHPLLTILSNFDVGVSSSPSNKTIYSFFSTFLLIAGYRDFECKRQYDIQVCEVSAKTIVS